MDINAIIAAKKFGKGGGGSIPKPIPYDYMPEGYPKKEVRNVTLFDQTITTNTDGFYSQAEVFDPLTIGETYYIYVDGVEYACVCYSIEMDGGNAPVVGNASLAGTNGGNGEPFLIMTANSMIMIGFENAANKEVAIKITHFGNIITPMAEEFLPSNIGGVKYCVFSKNDDETYSASMTYEAIKEAMLGGCVVLGVWGAMIFHVINASFMSDVATFASGVTNNVTFGYDYFSSRFIAKVAETGSVVLYDYDNAT